MRTLIKGAKLVNNGQIFEADVLISNQIIEGIFRKGDEVLYDINNVRIIDATGKYLLPGVIDDQVHFREPGLTHKGNIASESRAAAAGGVTSFMEMPNTKPASTSLSLLEEKYNIASETSLVNYSFWLGATNDNLEEIKKVNPKNVCGVKVFMGSSTGNMLVDNPDALSGIFAESPIIVATHCEDETIIIENNKRYKEQFGFQIPFKFHALIRSEEACYKSSAHAIELAEKYNTQLHILHLSTAKELSLFSRYIPNSTKITAEVCVHHLWFCDKDYDNLGSAIKCNPAIKKESDREALRLALKHGKLAVVATDHAPHTWEEKQASYFSAPSGLPLVQHSLPAMLEMYKKGIFSLEQIVDKMSHAPAQLFNISKRGYLLPGYFADLVLVDLNKDQVVEKSNILYRCKWSPFEGYTFTSSVVATWVNGTQVYCEGEILEGHSAMRLQFNR